MPGVSSQDVMAQEDGKEGTPLTPSASSPRPWMKINAADLAMSLGGEMGGMIMEGFLSGVTFITMKIVEMSIRNVRNQSFVSVCLWERIG
jgi:hypothetical protein